MKYLNINKLSLLMVSTIVSALFIPSPCSVLQAGDDSFKLLLLKPGEMLIPETFDKDSEKVQSWAKYGTQWQVVEGVFVGRPASLDYQKSHPGKHSGSTPRLEMKVPKCNDGFIMKFDFKFEKKIDGASFWLGHHLFKLIIKDNLPSMICTRGKKDTFTTALKPIDGPMIKNKWYSVMMEGHGVHRVLQVSGFEPLRVEGVSFDKISPVRMAGVKGASFHFDNFEFIKGAGLLKP
tara:strand:- start:176 stop:880 length:705 start_codon:yes stop_codon:yes gene_type:complete